VVAQHADAWNIAGVDIADATARSGLLDRYCAEVGRDPASITRSIHVPVCYDDPAATQDTVGSAVGARFSHVVLSPGTPYPDRVARDALDTPERAGCVTLP
jgi:alkanesulfonate monooxygenase SsuD/methylene tetrahydromethanopterin reductase-like flavin-dependent oxidoreductase (luciferase family)